MFVKPFRLGSGNILPLVKSGRGSLSFGFTNGRLCHLVLPVLWIELIINVLRIFERVKMGEPKLLDSFLFDYVDENDMTQYMADCKSFHQAAGQEIFIDVAFTGKFHNSNKARNPKFPSETLVRVQTRKQTTYKKRLVYPHGCVVFVAIDACGGIGPIGSTYMDEAFESLRSTRRLSRGRQIITPEGDDTPNWECNRAKSMLRLLWPWKLIPPSINSYATPLPYS